MKSDTLTKPYAVRFNFRTDDCGDPYCCTFFYTDVFINGVLIDSVDSAHDSFESEMRLLLSILNTQDSIHIDESFYLAENDILCDMLYINGVAFSSDFMGSMLEEYLAIFKVSYSITTWSYDDTAESNMRDVILLKVDERSQTWD